MLLLRQQAAISIVDIYLPSVCVLYYNDTPFSRKFHIKTELRLSGQSVIAMVQHPRTKVDTPTARKRERNYILMR